MEEARGRQRIYHLNADPLKEVKEWLNPFESYRQQQLDALNRSSDSEEI